MRRLHEIRMKGNSGSQNHDLSLMKRTVVWNTSKEKNKLVLHCGVCSSGLSKKTRIQFCGAYLLQSGDFIPPVVTSSVSKLNCTIRHKTLTVSFLERMSLVQCQRWSSVLSLMHVPVHLLCNLDNSRYQKKPMTEMQITTPLLLSPPPIEHPFPLSGEVSFTFHKSVELWNGRVSTIQLAFDVAELLTPNFAKGFQQQRRTKRRGGNS